MHLSDGGVPVALDAGDGEPVGLEVVVQDPRRRDLFPVVILGVIPEDGDARHAVLRLDVGGQPRRGEALHQGVERPAEQARLLARDDGHRPRIGQLGRRRARLLGRLAPGELGLQDGDHAVAFARLRLRARDDVAPRLGVGGVTRIEAGERVVLEGVVEAQA